VLAVPARPRERDPLESAMSVRTEHTPLGFVFSYQRHGVVRTLRSDGHDRTEAARIAEALAAMLAKEWAERMEAPDFVSPAETAPSKTVDPARSGPFNAPRLVP
jgi:hypothetical protein